MSALRLLSRHFYGGSVQIRIILVSIIAVNQTFDYTTFISDVDFLCKSKTILSMEGIKKNSIRFFGFV